MRGPGEIRFKEIRHHSATEEYFDISKSLLSHAPGSIHHDEKRMMEAGQYTYPFQFHVPAICPTSFEGQYGYVRYWVKVTIERPWKKDISAKKIFTVISPLDLSLEPNAAQPAYNTREKHICCMCCMSGPITATLRLSQKGYVPGETVTVSAEVNNSSRRKVDSISVELLMTTTFHTPHKSRSVTQQVARLHHGSLASGKSDKWEGDNFSVPSLPPSYLSGCSIMEIKYTLELRVFPVGPAFELAVPLEIIIGTVPLRPTLESYLPVHQKTSLTPSPVHNGAAITQTDDHRTSQHMSHTYSISQMSHFYMHDDDDDQCSLMANYVPRYTMYNFQGMPSKRQHTVRFAT
ncbi:unnamed protein product [Candidula unifasciata]|uniref:Arrestin C-terminal-like domain-containing protein n=1 Tax=Candidula unifasciata TaxID=100452 RepID=A0A8S3YH79_9EUPU|nr:unnamed protein product [Candidula unifasciata]